ncbi:MAG: WecB/TagA/CpsF family glycosyltransferase [Candidatus Synoicihabitans palmerolidicus]|nr:WecB/TagA/CpsF family glycosyltransferase [Candidatus Synoicihabitans palmerolidicus]
MNPARYNVLDVRVSALTLKNATAWITDSNRGYVCVTGVNGVIASQYDPALLQIHNQAALVTPDGMPLVWLGPPGVSRVYGPDLLLSVCDTGRHSDLRHYFYGGAKGMADKLAQRLQNLFPGLHVCSTFTPPFRPLDSTELVALQADVARCQPDIVWVGLSTSKQERFMAENHARLQCKLMIGVDAAFDFHTGRIKQAPRWIQRSGFEWLYRLSQDPRRLAPRYLRNNPRFIWLLLTQKLRRRTSE